MTKTESALMGTISKRSSGQVFGHYEGARQRNAAVSLSKRGLVRVVPTGATYQRRRGNGRTSYMETTVEIAGRIYPL